MTHGFDLDAALVCEGIVGDGCGGGRIFFIEDEKLQVYDPLTQRKMTLLDEVKEAKSISKKGCIIEIVCAKERVLSFNLSLMEIAK